MTNRIKVAFVKFQPQHKKTYMFEMPYDEYLYEGDTVLVPNANDDPIEAKVVETGCFNFEYETNKAEFDRLIAVAGAELPLKKVVGTVKRRYFTYKSEVIEDED